ncbi:hypothetical protein KDL45_10000, partial [bacterium]|nr:hypothetical protein [bacterium]
TAERIDSKPEEFLRNIRGVHELLAEHGVPFVVLAEATTYDDEVYHTGLSALAEREGLAFFDAYRYFRASPKAPEWFSDVVHLTPEGNRVMAGLVMDTVEKSGVLK